MNCERIDKYDYLIAMATLEANISEAKKFQDIDTSDVALDSKTRNRVERLIRTSRYYGNMKITKVRRVLSRVAVVLIIVMSIMFAAAMSISAVREAVWNAVMEWYDTYISVHYEPEMPVTPPSTILEVKKPALLPLGMEEDVLLNNVAVYYAEYYFEDNLCMIFKQTLLGEEENYADGEELNREDVMIGDNKGLLTTYAKNDNCQIMWNDGEYQYSLMGYNMGNDLLILIAESVK